MATWVAQGPGGKKQRLSARDLAILAVLCAAALFCLLDLVRARHNAGRQHEDGMLCPPAPRSDCLFTEWADKFQRQVQPDIVCASYVPSRDDYNRTDRGGWGERDEAHLPIE